MTTAELTAVVGQYLAEHFPGLYPSALTVTFHNHATPLQLPLAPVAQAAPRKLEQEDRGDGLSPVVLDILEVLRDIKRPLTRTRILEELAKRGKLHGERTVAGYLARMVEDGTLSNPGAGKGGYKLTPEDE